MPKIHKFTNSLTHITARPSSLGGEGVNFHPPAPALSPPGILLPSLYGAAHTCMVRAVLYCTVLRAFSHFHAIYRCFPYSCTPCKPDSQLKIDPTPTPPTPIMCVVNLRIETPMALRSRQARRNGWLKRKHGILKVKVNSCCLRRVLHNGH